MTPLSCSVSCTGVGDIGVLYSDPVLEASVLRGIELESELVTLVLVEKTGTDDGGYRPVIGGKPGNENAVTLGVSSGWIGIRPFCSGGWE